MISIFLHLLALAYGTVNLAGYAGHFPLTFTCLWVFVTFLILIYYLPEFIDQKIESTKIPSFSAAQSWSQWLITTWIITLHAFSDPIRLAFPQITILPQTLPMLISMILYISLSKPVYFEMYRLFRPILDVKQTSSDFFRARMTIPILFFPPIMFWMLLEDLTTGKVDAFTEIKMLILAPFFFIALYLLAPKLFNWAWKAEENTDPELNETVIEISRKAQTPVSGVKIWNTFNEPVPNAAVAGLSARFRFVYITRFLLEIFSPEQVKSVIAHEMAHLRLGHVASYMTYSINLVLISVILKLSNIIYFPHLMPESNLATLAEMLFFIVIFALSFTALARHCEYQADAFACSIANPENLASGLQTLNGMVMPPPKIFPSWLLTHPPIQDRIDRARLIGSSGIEPLVKKAEGTRRKLIVAGLLMVLIAVIPAKAAYKIAGFQKAVQTGNTDLALSQYVTLPEWLKTHPLVISEKGQLAVKRGSWLLAITVAIESEWGFRRSDLEVLHHSGAPEVALDFEVMKFVLQSLDLG